MALIHPARHLVLNIGGPAELLAFPGLSPDLNTVPGVCIRTADDVAVVDTGSGWCRKIRQVQWMPSPIDFLLARAIFPLSSAAVLFADSDSLGDLTQAARAVAGLCRFAPYVRDLLPPSLIVLTVKDCTQEAFNNHVTDELLEILRAEHPQDGHSRQAVLSHWRSRVRSVQIIQKKPSKSWSDIIKSATLTTEERWNGGFGFSDRAFRRLFCYAIENCNTESFHCLRAYGIHALVTPAAQNYVTTFLRSLSTFQKEHAEIIASCLVVNAYRDDAYGKFRAMIRSVPPAYIFSLVAGLGCRKPGWPSTPCLRAKVRANAGYTIPFLENCSTTSREKIIDPGSAQRAYSVMQH